MGLSAVNFLRCGILAMRKYRRSNPGDFAGTRVFHNPPSPPSPPSRMPAMVGLGEWCLIPPPSEITPAETEPISRVQSALQLCAVESGWAGFDVEDFAEST